MRAAEVCPVRGRRPRAFAIQFAAAPPESPLAALLSPLLPGLSSAPAPETQAAAQPVKASASGTIESILNGLFGG